MLRYMYTEIKMKFAPLVLLKISLPKNCFVTSGPKKNPMPLEESITPGLETGSDHKVPATISSSSASNGLLKNMRTR